MKKNNFRKHITKDKFQNTVSEMLYDKKKLYFAFSGGLDTSVVVKYLQEKHDMDVVTVTVDVGQRDDQKKIAAKAKKLGV